MLSIAQATESYRPAATQGSYGETLPTKYHPLYPEVGFDTCSRRFKFSGVHRTPGQFMGKLLATATKNQVTRIRGLTIKKSLPNADQLTHSEATMALTS